MQKPKRGGSVGARQLVARPYVPPPRQPRGAFARPAGDKLTVVIRDESRGTWPNVLISSVAHGKMRALIEACPIEVSWLATVRRVGRQDVLLEDIFVPPQSCSMGSTLVTEDGEAALLAELLAEGNHDAINALACWGHSHVHGGVFASGTDELQTEDFLRRARESRKSHFVRLVANKYDDLFASVYQIAEGIEIHHAPIRAEKPLTGRYRAWAKREVELKVKKIRLRRPKRRGKFPFAPSEGYYEGLIPFADFFPSFEEFYPSAGRLPTTVRVVTPEHPDARVKKGGT